MGAQLPHIIRRPDRGLTISGTRITLYALMDYVRAGWDGDRIRAALGLSAAQLRVALDYIGSHQAEVQAEYEEVLREAEANRRHWEASSAAQVAVRPRAAIPPEKAALYAKLAEQREQTIRDLLEEEAARSPEAAHP